MMLLYVVLISTVVAVVVAAPAADIKIQVNASAVAPIPETFDKNGRFFIDDMEINPLRNGVLRSERWPSGQVPYIFDSGFPSSARNIAIAAMREIEQDVNSAGDICVQFVPRGTQRNYIRIYRGSGCHSAVGYQNTGAHEVSLGVDCDDNGIMMHELIHTLGFWHEQNRPDRDRYITIDLTNVATEHKDNFKLLSASSVSTYNTPYDFGSLMHYGPYTFAVDASRPVITPKTGQAVGVVMGQRTKPSKIDVRRIQRLYQCTEDAEHIIDPLEAVNQLIICNFENGVCGMTVDMSTTVHWVTANGSSAHGPKAGNDNGADRYLVAVAAGHQATAKISTPSYNKGSICIDFYLFQKGPTSYLDIYAAGSRIPRQRMFTYKNVNHNEWYHNLLELTMSAGADFKISFEAHIVSDDVAIDDILIYQGKCIE